VLNRRSKDFSSTDIPDLESFRGILELGTSISILTIKVLHTKTILHIYIS
jgi:hypothetical protein